MTLGDPGRLTGGYLYHRRMAEVAPDHGARVRFVSFPNRPFPLPAAAGPGVLATVREQDAEVVALDSIAAAFLAPWLVAGSVEIPVVGSLHQPPGGIDHGPLRTRMQRALDRAAWRRSVRLVSASEALARDLADEGFGREKVVVVPPGRDVAASAEAVGDLRQGRGAAFLCVANWIPRKGIAELLEAFRTLPADAATLHLAGDDRADPAYARQVRALVAESDLAGRVVVHGPVSRERVAGLYAAADAFVLPSRREPFGTVLGEAMAAGLPVVGWRAGNLPHLAEDGREGLVLPPGDVPALARALATLAGDEDLRRRLGEAARRRARARPTWEESAARFFAVLREAARR